MAVFFTPFLNQTVTGAIDDDPTPRDSVSVRIRGLCPGGYVRLFGVTWSVTGPDDNSQSDVRQAKLFIIQNEVFDENFNYNGALTNVIKDVVFRDHMTPMSGNPAVLKRIAEWGRHINFTPPLKLTGASDYLIICPAPQREGNPGDDFQVSLTARGEIFSGGDTMADRAR